MVAGEGAGILHGRQRRGDPDQLERQIAQYPQAAEYAKSVGVPVITFTGFAEDNPLKSAGTLNFWVNSRAYNHIECVHMIWLTAVVDLIIGKAEYRVS